MVTRRSLLLGSVGLVAGASMASAQGGVTILRLGSLTLNKGSASGTIRAGAQPKPTKWVWIDRVSGDAEITSVKIRLAGGGARVAKEDKLGTWRTSTGDKVSFAEIKVKWTGDSNSASFTFSGAIDA